MSMSYPAVVRVLDQFAPPLTAAGDRTADELDRLGLVCEALAEVTSGSVSVQWSRQSQRAHSEALMKRVESAAVQQDQEHPEVA